MLHVMEVKRGTASLKVDVGSKGLVLCISDKAKGHGISWLMHYFPEAFVKAACRFTLGAEGLETFIYPDVRGTFRPALEPEGFIELVLGTDGNCYSISLRRTEVDKLAEIIQLYWTE